ncbi:MAG: hypothetical protein KDD25_01930 [Bdellovibrionales bacterium]|nr:hypothetical protein [Bdellovibrionales bacterium]
MKSSPLASIFYICIFILSSVVGNKTFAAVQSQDSKNLNAIEQEIFESFSLWDEYKKFDYVDGYLDRRPLASTRKFIRYIQDQFDSKKTVAKNPFESQLGGEIFKGVQELKKVQTATLSPKKLNTEWLNTAYKDWRSRQYDEENQIQEANTLEIMRVALQLYQSDDIEDENNVLPFVIGDTATSLWTAKRDLAGVISFIYLISKNSHSEFAELAWLKLNSHIHFMFSGSSGDHTPNSWLTLLNDLKLLSRQKLQTLK